MNKNFLTLILLFSLLAFRSGAQTFWVQHAGGQTIDEGVDVSSDANGNSYAVGYFTGNATFGTTTLHSAGATDIYIAKLNHAGLFNWIVRAGGGGSDHPSAIKADPQGNSYITGYFFGTAHFGIYTLTSSGLQDAFIAKYDSAGNCLWAKNCGGTASDIGNGITVDNAGNVIVTGQFKDTATFGSFNLISMNGTVDVFTTKLDANGTFLWAKKGSGPYIDRGFDVAADAMGNIYVTGQFSDTITFDFQHNNPMYNAIFLIKYDANGNEQWFRRAGGGGLDIPRGIVVDNAGNPIIAGDFQGGLTVFSAPTNSTLSDNYFNRIFVIKFDASGNCIWKSASSSDATLNLKNLAIDAANSLYAIGNFTCRLNKYADVYGQGTFNSVGYSDIFVSKWDASGTWQWSRQVGGFDNDYGNGISIDTSQNPVITGSNYNGLLFPARVGHFLVYNSGVGNYGCTQHYCGDNFYNQYAYINTSNNANRDIFIGRMIDTARQTMDLYQRTDSLCNRDVKGVYINSNNGVRVDSVSACNSTILGANPRSCLYNIGLYPYHYLWSNGSTLSNSTTLYTSGWYSVTITTNDGCFSSHDSIYVTIHPSPSPPLITDDHGFNNHVLNPFIIHTCRPDSMILLTGTPYSGDSIYHWSGGPVNDSMLLVHHTGYYTFYQTDSFRCQSATQVYVVVDSFLTPIVPGMICPTDSDHNDTVSFCDYNNAGFQMFLYDTITNPNHVSTNSPYLLYNPWNNNNNTMFNWSVTPTTCSYQNWQTCCGDYTWFHPWASGWYTLTAIIYRLTDCDNDTTTVTRSIYVNIYPIPVLISYTPSISGNTVFCPSGDTILLVATGMPAYHWSTGSTNDSIYATHTGTYIVSYTERDTNSYGCTATQFFQAQILLTAEAQPTLSMIPSSGLICPGDSVHLTCSGTGNFSWQGPSGPITGNTSSIYAHEAGTYYCILTNSSGCVLVTNEVEIIEYNTPYIQVMPDVFFCAGDSVLLSVIASPGATITWQSPLSGNNPNQYVHVGGSYSCSVTSCNITTTAYATIQQSNPVAHITSDSVSLCVGDTMILFGNLGMATYYWLPGGSGYPNDTITHAGTYKLFITDPYGCAAKDSIVITSPNDSVRSIYTATPLSGCNPLTVTFSNSSYNSNSYLWMFGDGGSSSAINPVHTYDTSGTFSVTLIAYNTNSCGTFSNISVHTNYITVYPLVTASFTADTTHGCTPFTVNFTNTSINATTYHWDFGDLTTSTATSPSHTYTTAGNYTITLIAYDTHGCNDTTTMPAFIIVNNSTVPTSSFTANPLAACDSITVHFNNTSTNGTNFLWSFGDGNTDTTMNPTHTYTVSGTYTVKLYSYNTSICGTIVDSSIQSNYITVNPSAHANFIPSDTTGCVPFTINFMNGSTAAIGYGWAFGDGNTSTVLSPNNTYHTAGVYIVTLIADGAGGCNDTALFSFISVINPPHVTSSFVADTFRGCTPLTINFTDLGTGGTSYLWSFGDSITSTLKNPVHTFVDSGLFTIKLVAINDTSICGIYSDSTIINDYIQVGDSSNITTNFSGFPIKGCTPLVVNITNVSSNGTACYWDFGNGEYSNDLSLKSFIYYRAGSYKITLINYNSDARCANKPDTMSIEINADSCLISIPNTFTPNKDGYNDYFNLIAEGCTHYHVLIFNRWGEKIFESFQNNLLWDGYDTSGMQVSDGTYYYIFTALDYYDQPISQKGFITLVR